MTGTFHISLLPEFLRDKAAGKIDLESDVYRIAADEIERLHFEFWTAREMKKAAQAEADRLTDRMIELGEI